MLMIMTTPPLLFHRHEYDSSDDEDDEDDEDNEANKMYCCKRTVFLLLIFEMTPTHIGLSRTLIASLLSSPVPTLPQLIYWLTIQMKTEMKTQPLFPPFLFRRPSAKLIRLTLP
jgi:hypothetical protein